MNRKTIFLSLTCLTALLFLLPVLLHATELGAPNPGQALQDDACLPDTPVSAEEIRDIYGPILLPEPPPFLHRPGDRRQWPAGWKEWKAVSLLDLLQRK
jgi:hypothetical protein